MTPSVRLFDENFNLLAEIDDFEQLYFKRCFFTYGDFEMVIDAKKRNTDILRRGIYFVVSAERAGIVDYIEKTETDNSEKITVKGYTLEHILTRRITYPKIGSADWSAEGNAETVIKNLINFNLGLMADNARKIPELEIAQNLGRGDSVKISTCYKNLDEEVKKLCMDAGLGVRILFLNNKLFLETQLGKNLTPSQEDNPPVIFSSDYDNIFDQVLIDGALDYKNTAITAGKGSGVNREITTVFENADEPATGISRREVFADITDSNVTSAELPSKGFEKLKETPCVLSFEGKVNTNNSMAFGKDYNLGDIILMKYTTVQKETRITEITENWDANLYTIDCTFGEKIPTFLDKIKQGVRT